MTEDDQQWQDDMIEEMNKLIVQRDEARAATEKRDRDIAYLIGIGRPLVASREHRVRVMRERDEARTALAEAHRTLADKDGLLYDAWAVIANAGVLSISDMPSPGVREAAVCWRDAFHQQLPSVRSGAESAGEQQGV